MIKRPIINFHTYFSERHKNTRLICWAVLACLILIVDYFTGSIIQFPVMFIVPVGLASWYNGPRWGVAYAIVLPLIRLYFTIISPAPSVFSISIVNAAIRITMLAAYALLIAHVAKQKMELEREVNILKGILPVCGFCKKIRDEHDVWHPMETYITEHSEAMFSHGFCPECGEKHYGDLLRRGRKKTAQDK